MITPTEVNSLKKRASKIQEQIFKYKAEISVVKKQLASIKAELKKMGINDASELKKCIAELNDSIETSYKEHEKIISSIEKELAQLS